MKKIFAAFALALALGGCAQLRDFGNNVSAAFKVATGDIVTPKQVAVALYAFDAAKATATNYVRLPLCPEKAPVCRTHSVTLKVQAWMDAGTADRAILKAAVRANPNGNLTLVNVYQDLRNTTAQIVAAVGH